MIENDNPTMDRDTMPFVAPCRIISPLAPFGWLRKGVANLLAGASANKHGQWPKNPILRRFTGIILICVGIFALAMPYLHTGSDAGDHQHAAISSDS
jgi:hypothetical protein